MKKTTILILALLLMLLPACSSTEPTERELMIPDGRSLEHRLPYLENLNQGTNGRNNIEEHSPTYTIWEREL